MNRKEFLAQLERLLYDVPVQERDEALDYYNSYFDDAGEENESSVIQELGSPGKVAAIIKADLTENRKEYGEYTESGFQDERFDSREMPEQAGKSHEEKEEEKYSESKYTTDGNENQNGYDGPYSRYGYGSAKSPRNKNGIMWGLLIVLAILTCPIWGGLLIGACGVLFGVLAAAFGVFVAVLASGAGLFGGGIVMIVYSMLHLLGTPATALAIAGAGMVMMAIGLLLLIAFLWCMIKVFPPLFRWVINLIQRIFHRGIRGGRDS